MDRDDFANLIDGTEVASSMNLDDEGACRCPSCGGRERGKRSDSSSRLGGKWLALFWEQ
jgi:hypothetical protein